MERKIFKQLNEWKTSDKRKPLILWGARQVGKTWTLKEFGQRCFNNTIYISFYNNRRMASIFDSDYDVDRILKRISVETHSEIFPNQTLIIFDEVQNAPHVVESLKAFCEDAREYCVTAAGSLLGVALHEGISFPVGKVNELHLYPMSFSEFLTALNEEKLASYLTDYHNAEINDFKEMYLEYLKQYFVTGGMPEVVEDYRVNRDFSTVREIQNDILHQYEGDFGKHVNGRELPRIKMVWNSLPVQLAKENRKFFFGKIKKGARSKDYEIALQWLKDSGLIHIVNKVSKPAVPLKSYVDLASFKVFFNDVGLLGAMSGLEPDSVLENGDLFVEFKGAMTEQYVLQQLVAETNYQPYYYASDKSTYEMDFLIQKQGTLVPIEVKAGMNLKSKSFQMFCEKFDCRQAIRLSRAEMKDQGWMTNVPLWAVEAI